MKTVRAFVSGRVQGVGFRYFVRHYADDLSIKGYARNLPDGRVEVLMQGEQAGIDILIGHIRSGPRFSSVVSVDLEEIKNAAVQHSFVTG